MDRRSATTVVGQELDAALKTICSSEQVPRGPVHPCLGGPFAWQTLSSDMPLPCGGRNPGLARQSRPQVAT